MRRRGPDPRLSGVAVSVLKTGTTNQGSEVPSEKGLSSYSEELIRSKVSHY